eukprot:2077350-Rhodomonas_salina.1
MHALLFLDARLASRPAQFTSADTAALRPWLAHALLAAAAATSPSNEQSRLITLAGSQQPVPPPVPDRPSDCHCETQASDA